MDPNTSNILRMMRGRLQLVPVVLLCAIAPMACLRGPASMDFRHDDDDPSLALSESDASDIGEGEGEGEGEIGEGEGEIGEGEGEIGEGEGEGACAGITGIVNAPTLTAPIDGSVDVLTSELVLEATGPLEPANYARTELEIVRVRNGLVAERVWHKDVVVPISGSIAVAFADGVLENDGALDQGLKPFKNYVARARHVYAVVGCERPTGFSAVAGFRTDDGSRTLFDRSALSANTIRTVDITLSPQSMATLNAQALPGGCTNYLRDFVVADVVVAGEAFAGAGIHIKGGCGSSRDLTGKPSFKINLSWDDPGVSGCPVERRYLGQKSLTLNNGVQDPTGVREQLGYDFYRSLGVPAPRTNSVLVNINGAPYGIYTLVESYDRRMLGRHFASNDGMMYEGAYWCDITQGNVPLDLDGYTCFDREFSTDICDADENGALPTGDATDWETLRTFAASLDLLDSTDTFYPGIYDLMDFDVFLSMWSADAVISHWDGYTFQIINNYRVYHDPSTDLYSILPWGIDQTFDTENFGGDVDPWQGAARIVTSCLADAACTAAFAQRLAEATTQFESMDLGAQADTLFTAIAPMIEADPRKEYSVDAWRARQTSLRNWIATRPARVRQHLANHGF